MIRVVHIFSLYFLLGLFLSCQSTPDNNQATDNQSKESGQNSDPLPSWNEGQVKTSIINFVAEATNEKSENYIPKSERIATFDNDGTLISEKPLYFQFYFALDRIKALASSHPEWSDQQPLKAAIDNDMDAIKNAGLKGIMEIVMLSHANNTVEEFEEIVKDWLATAKHPRFNRPYNELIFQPMLELLDFLRANSFKTYIISAGGIEFMRPWTESAYGIPKEQVFGSSVKTKFVNRNGEAIIIRLPEVNFIDDKEGKPAGIYNFIGRKPVFSVGNSDGDLQMMQYTDTQKNSFKLYVHHTDSIREWAYDRNSIVGKFDKGLDEALAKGWTIIDMKKDWKVIYPFELEIK